MPDTTLHFVYDVIERPHKKKTVSKALCNSDVMLFITSALDGHQLPDVAKIMFGRMISRKLNDHCQRLSKGIVHFGKKGKLAPRYVGPFKILERIGLVAYRLRLLEELNSVHDTFHVSNLKKCLADANLHVPLDGIKVYKTLRFAEEPVEIMDREIRKLKRRKIVLMKVR
ncbi:hypothetical protein Tco_0593466 [Tanacetum coccineum]